MNIAIVTTWFERGAAYVSRQYRQALAPSHHVFIYARGGEASAVNDPVWDDRTVTWAPQGVVPVAGSMDLSHFASWLKRHDIQLVLFNEQHWWEPVVLANELGLTTAAYVDYYTPETVPLFAAYDLLICNTRRHHSVFTWHPHAHYVPWGTDLDTFRPHTFDVVSSSATTFFHSAGLNPIRKGTDLLLKAFDRVTGSAHLVIHAQESLDTLFPELRGLLARLVANDRLTLHERTVAAPGLYHLGDVYVYPSRLDGLGLTVAEALACGLPIIVPDSPPMNEFLDGTNGASVSVNRTLPHPGGYYWPLREVAVDALAAQMRHFITTRASLPLAKRAARRYAETRLDWSARAADLARIFQKSAPLPTPFKRQAITAARRFETQRARSSIRQWLSLRFPGPVAWARGSWRTMTRQGIRPTPQSSSTPGS